MMIAKTLFVLSGLLGLANAQPGSAIYCDNSDFPGPKEVRLTQTYRGGVKVVLTLSCKGDGIAYANFVEDAPEGFTGAMIAGDDSMPMCANLFYVYSEAKKYETVCRGRGFKITQTLKIKDSTPAP